MLNSTQVNQLFRQNAMLFGNCDGVPECRVVELFGEEAVDYVMRKDYCEGFYNGYGIGDCTVGYLTYKGFRVAATYANVREVKKREADKSRAKELGLNVIKMRVKARTGLPS